MLLMRAPTILFGPPAADPSDTRHPQRWVGTQWLPHNYPPPRLSSQGWPPSVPRPDTTTRHHPSFLPLPPTSCHSPALLSCSLTLSICMAPGLTLEPHPGLPAPSLSQSCPSTLPNPKAPQGPAPWPLQVSPHLHLHSVYPSISNSLLTPHSSLPQCLCIYGFLCRDS